MGGTCYVHICLPMTATAQQLSPRLTGPTTPNSHQYHQRAAILKSYIASIVPLPYPYSTHRYHLPASCPSPPINMRCLLYVASFLASAAAASADPCPPKPICGRTDCYNEWINCFDEAEKPGVSMVSPNPPCALTTSTTVTDAVAGCCGLLE